MKTKHTRRLPISPPKEPKGLDEYINYCVISQAFMIYSTKEHIATCTSCGTRFLIDREYVGQHGLYCDCPKCGRRTRIQSEGRSRDRFREFHRLLVFTRRGGTVYATLYGINADFRPFGKAYITKTIFDVWVISSKKQCHYEHYWPYYSDSEYWFEDNHMKIPFPGGNYPVELYSKNIDEIFEKTDLKYLNIPGFADKCDAEWLVKYMSDGMKYQAVELLAKGGFPRLVKERITGGRCGACNWRGKNLEKIMRLSTGDIRKLRQHNPDNTSLYIYQRLTPEERIKTPWETIRQIAYFNSTLKDIDSTLARARKYSTLDKWWDYINRQTKNANKSQEYRYWGYNTMINEWNDYIDMAEKLGMDVDRKKICFPEDLIKAHDKASDRITIEKDRKREEAIKKNAKHIDYSNEHFTVVAGDSQVLLNEESRGLSHCVKTYGDKIARGGCWIFFIRRTEEKDTPFYTLETTTKGDMVQCRGNHNCDMTDEVKTFVDLFIKALKTELKKEAKKCKITTQSAAQPAA